MPIILNFIDHKPIETSEKRGTDNRLLDLLQIYDQQLPRMGGIKILNTVRSTQCRSFVCCENDKIVGGCTFKLHESAKLIELLLLGVQKSYQKLGLGTRMIKAMKDYVRD